MARARNIKPAFFDNDELADIDPLGRLLFIGLWTLADFKGDLEWRSKRIKKQLLAYDDCNISELAINLDKSGFIRFYSDGNKIYLNVSNFTKHQNPHKNERLKGSEIPAITNEMRQAIDLDTLAINRDLSGLERNDSNSNRADSLILIPDSPILKPEPLNKDPMSCKPDVVEIINYMNSVIGTKYKTSTKSHIQNISARLSEGHSVDDLKKVIDFKYSQWGNSQEMAGFLRPSTLFQTSKFQGYLTASKTVSSGQHRDINEIGTDFSAPAGFRKMIFNDHGEMIGYESETKI